MLVTQPLEKRGEVSKLNGGSFEACWRNFNLQSTECEGEGQTPLLPALEIHAEDGRKGDGNDSEIGGDAHGAVQVPGGLSVPQWAERRLCTNHMAK